jgi:hypothetical protein
MEFGDSMGRSENGITHAPGKAKQHGNESDFPTQEATRVGHQIDIKRA